MTDSSCIFCDIVTERLASFTLLSNQHYTLVLDIRPITFGHMLVLSRSHTSHIHQLPKVEYEAIMDVARQISEKLPQAISEITDCNLVINNGKHANQHIPHCHVHIIPRRKGDNLAFYWRLLTRFILPFHQLNHKKNLQKAQQLLAPLL